MEAMVVLTIMGVMMSLAVPSFRRAIEQSKADIAAASLASIWSAQRLYWLDHRVYAPDLATLAADGLIDPALLPANTAGFYTYTVQAAADQGSFTATATRNEGSGWSGSYTIDQTGTVSGGVQGDGKSPITPGGP